MLEQINCSQGFEVQGEHRFQGWEDGTVLYCSLYLISQPSIQWFNLGTKHGDFCDILADISDRQARSQLEQARGTSQKAMTTTFQSKCFLNL